MRKGKRLLSVHPMDFESEDYLPHSRRASVQVSLPGVFTFYMTDLIQLLNCKKIKSHFSI